MNIYQQGLDRSQANHAPLSPLTFLERAAMVHPRRIAVVHGQVRRTWAEVYARSRRLASALRRHGVGPGVTVAAMLPNVPAMYEAHFGVPMAGGVLNGLNIRLDAEAIAFMLHHGEARVLFTDREFSGVIEAALARLEHKPLVIDVEDALFTGGQALGDFEY